MSASFEIQRRWLPGAPDAALDEIARAELSIIVNGVCVTEVDRRFEHDARSAVRLSALQMANWFAGNWWRLRWEPEQQTPSLDWKMTHHLASAGGGYLWPDLVFSSDGETMLVRSIASPNSSREPIRYLRDYSGVIAIASFEHTVDDFVNAAIARLQDESPGQTGLPDIDLPELWKIIADERNDPVMYELRQLEARLGYDPGEAPESLLAGLQELRLNYGAAAIQEMAAASKDSALSHLEDLRLGIQQSATPIRIADCDLIQQAYVQLSNPSPVPWQRGMQAAHIARSKWGFRHGPVPTTDLSNIFGLDITDYQSVPMPVSAGLRHGSAGSIYISLNQPRLTGRRFALARLAADHFAAPEGDKLLPLTAARTSRQKFQRAFAQEFLCPIDDLLDFLGPAAPDNDDIDDAAAHFGVSPLTIRTTLVNKGVMERELLGEWVV